MVTPPLPWAANESQGQLWASSHCTRQSTTDPDAPWTRLIPDLFQKGFMDVTGHLLTWEGWCKNPRASRDWTDNGAWLAKLARKSTKRFVSQPITIFMVVIRNKSVLQQNCCQLLFSQSSWCLTESFGKPLSLAALTALSLFHTPPFFQEGKSLSQGVFFALDFTFSSPAAAEGVTHEGSWATAGKWQQTGRIGLGKPPCPGLKGGSEGTPEFSHDATEVVQGK